MISNTPSRSHVWIARTAEKSECKRCGSARFILADGETYFATPTGVRTNESPVCSVPSGSRKSSGAAVGG